MSVVAVSLKKKVHRQVPCSPPQSTSRRKTKHFRCQRPRGHNRLPRSPHTLPNRCVLSPRCLSSRSQCHSVLPRDTDTHSYCSPPTLGVCSKGLPRLCVSLSPCTECRKC